MSCCDKLKTERLKAFRHAEVLALQTASILNTPYGIVIKENKWGKFYEGINVEENEGAEFLLILTKGDKIKKRLPKGVVEVLD